MADRFFCPEPPVHGVATLQGDEARHLARVCRAAVGDCVELFDGKGRVFQAEVVDLGRDRVGLRIVADLPPGPAPAYSLTLATAVPKGDRFDWLVEKASELGVAKLVPLNTERSVVDPRGSKLDRLRRAAVEAAKQCRRDRVLELAESAAWPDLVRADPGSPRYLADPSGLPFRDWPAPPPGSTPVLAVGPEGGFTPAEVDEAISLGWQPIALASHILRIETAGIAGATLLLARAGGD